MKTILITLAAAPFIISGIKNLEPVQGDGTIPNGASIVHAAYEHLTLENVNSLADKVLNPTGNVFTTETWSHAVDLNNSQYHIPTSLSVDGLKPFINIQQVEDSDVYEAIDYAEFTGL